MKKKILLLMGIFSLGLSYAQVGINTQNLSGVFHIDPKGDTNAAGTSGTDDDIVITTDGKVGIGTISPTRTLDLQGNFKLVDGTQADGYFLTSDNGGYGSWKPNITTKSFIDGVRSVPNITSSTPVYTGSYITLDSGTWMIAFTCTYRDPGVANHMVWRLSTSSTSLVPYINNAKSTAYTGAALAAFHTSVSAYFLVTNTAAQTYYFWVSAGASTGSALVYTGEFKLYAIPLS
ncbi:hypothetical protein [Dysgonomonas macrotermitis]|nr:hypothetical protein [Dysgonomonas macrotermitis]